MTNKVYKLMNWPKIEEIIYSECDDPQTLLGPHRAGNQTLVQAYFPGEESADVVFKDGTGRFPMEKADDDGYFAVLLPFSVKNLPAYRYEVTTGGAAAVREEAYRFEPQITRQDTEKFKNGIHYTIYEKLGAHPMELDGVKGTCFAVWAPSALRVSVVGDFNGWDGRVHQMRRLWDSGIFELFVPGAEEGQNYKFELKLKNGLTYLKADPYGNAAQLRPETASVIADLNGFSWEDEKFIANRPAFQTGEAPLSVYEMYLGSFVKPEEGQEYANYRQIAEKLIPYVREMGYTHVELMPVMEHPLDASWGYQVIGYYAPTSRYGSPEDFMYFVNELHKAGIGVILDWVPAHFPRDSYGLSNFDGTCLYEHKDPRQGFHPHWGTLIYNYGRSEVSNYLIANALFWVEKFHADGIRMDAVASMLYLDYGKGDGGWIPNIYGGNENLEAIELIKHLNSVMKKRNPGAITVAEESTAFPRITGALDEEGLGFDYKWNMGFMNDYLGYIRYDPYFRSYHHGELTFSMIYAYSERFMLVFSHDEVVHGKATLLGKMPGGREQKFANLRLSYAFMMTHPGRKLLFMGQDVGEFDEWNEGRQVEWELCSVPEHEGVRGLVRDLNGLYRSLSALHSLDDSPEGFQWINHISAQDCYLTYARMGEKPEELLLVAANFAGVPAEITTGVPLPGKYKEILNTDDVKYGGTGVVNGRAKRSRKKEWDDRPDSITVKLAPLSLSILKYIPDETEKGKGGKSEGKEKPGSGQKIVTGGKAGKRK
ncbi:MAG: 1,4-alpha-glucan branching protein GlgB [Roseburia sp.]|nr:1,4-alpha-glucan branching protein GlgB [Roseburia sp.]MCM1097375.1 1,4-alpha-glucan branching protein GlgB [Ruminococcus flavefaciens]